MTPHILKLAAAVAAMAGGMAVIMRQCRKPAWWPGRLFLWSMNLRHSGLTDWGLKRVKLERDFTILDVGCGGGRTVQKLAALAGDGRVYGIDYSSTSVAASRRKNAAEIRAGRVEILEGSVASLPFPDATFDLVTAVETHYYWPDIEACTREIVRVLKPGGTVAIIAEAYRGGGADAMLEPVMKALQARLLSVEEHYETLGAAGCSDVDVAVERGKGWLCAVGRRPAAPDTDPPR